MKDISKMSHNELLHMLEAIHMVLEKAVPRSIEYSKQQVPEDKAGQYASQAGFLEGTINGILRLIFEQETT